MRHELFQSNVLRRKRWNIDGVLAAAGGGCVSLLLLPSLIQSNVTPSNCPYSIVGFLEIRFKLSLF
jgi:hypothetical protein